MKHVIFDYTYKQIKEYLGSSVSDDFHEIFRTCSVS